MEQSARKSLLRIRLGGEADTSAAAGAKKAYCLNRAEGLGKESCLAWTKWIKCRNTIIIYTARSSKENMGTLILSTILPH